MSISEKFKIVPAHGVVCVLVLNPDKVGSMTFSRDDLPTPVTGPGIALDEDDITRLINDLAARLTAWREDSLSLPDLVLKIMETHGGYSREFRAAQIAQVVKRRVLRDAHIAQED